MEATKQFGESTSKTGKHTLAVGTEYMLGRCDNISLTPANGGSPCSRPLGCHQDCTTPASIGHSLLMTAEGEPPPEVLQPATSIRAYSQFVIQYHTGTCLSGLGWVDNVSSMHFHPSYRILDLHESQWPKHRPTIHVLVQVKVLACCLQVGGASPLWPLLSHLIQRNPY